MKKVLLSGCLIATFLVGGIYFFQYKNHQVTDESKAEVIVLEAKTDGAESLADLESKAPIIIKGVKVEEIGTKQFKSEFDGGFIGGYTESNFKITEVYKNKSSNSKIKIDNNITILENSIYDNQTGKIYTVNGYQKMEKDGEYLLFLYDEVEELFAPYGVLFGKVSLGNNAISEIRLYNTVDESTPDIVREITAEARKKYLNLEAN